MSGNQGTPAPEFKSARWGTAMYTEQQVEFMKKKRPMNVALGLGAFASVVGIYFYSIHKVSQNSFDDIDEKGNVKKV